MSYYQMSYPKICHIFKVLIHNIYFYPPKWYLGKIKIHKGHRDHKCN